MKKIVRVILFFVPFLLGVIGYYGVAGESLGNSLFYSMSFYALSFVSEAPNLLVEFARWLAPLMTAGGVILIINSLRERLRAWIVGARKGSIAVCGAEEKIRPVLEELGARGIRIRDRLPRAERYIFLGEERENFLFYEKYQKELAGKQVYLRCASMNGRKAAPDLKLFSEEEIAARLYWKKYGIWQEAREKDYRMKLVFLQFGPLEEQLLLWGLQNNIFSPGQELEYHIFGETGRFRAIYHELDHMEDRIIYHEEPWYEAQALLLEADRIFVCDTTGVLSDLLYALPQKRVHVLADGRDVACYEEQSRLVVFNWKQEALTVEHILDEALLVQAKHINLRYAHLYSGVEETKQNLEDQWNQLDAFTRYSNISAADYHEVRLQMIEDWKQETGKQEPDEEYLRYLAELEHIRWNRYHYIHNWRLGTPENGKNKDKARRIHRDLIPFGELTEGEKEKDAENIRVLLSMDVCLAGK